VPAGRARERYLDAALAVLAANEALTLHRLAQELGRSHTAVYRHFRDLDDLVGELVDREFSGTLLGAVDGAPGPREAVLGLAMAVRDTYRTNPALASAFARLPHPGAGMAAVSALMVGLLRDLGLEGDRLATAYQALESVIIGTSAYDYGRAPEHLATRRVRLAELDDPAFTRATRDDTSVDEHNDRAFRFAVAAVLDACTDPAGRR